MKPYALRGDGKDDTWCCLGHSWPKIRKIHGHYSSPHSKRKTRKLNKRAKRVRRHTDKQKLNQREIESE